MNKKCIFASLIGISTMFVGCNEKQREMMFGDTSNIYLPVNEKLVSISNSPNNTVWYLTRPMVEGDTAVTYKFREVDSHGNFTKEKTIRESQSNKN